MNRTERLLNLLQILRSYRYPVSGQKLAARLNISIRTLYRDIATLQSQGAEIEGEAGIGYVLKSGFFMPPLMFSDIEVDALVLGMLWVSTFGDASLSKAADVALSKIRHVLPRSIKDGMGSVPLRVGPPASKELKEEDLTMLRDSIRKEQKIEVTYCEKSGGVCKKVVWPFAIGYFTSGRILVSWCEKTEGYIHIKTESILSVTNLPERYLRRREVLFKDWQSIQLRKIELIPIK